MIRRFEVFKRIHSRYTFRFRAFDTNEFANLELYVRAAEVFEKAYSRAFGLPCLNVLLKILDTLCAMVDGLSSEERIRLKVLLGKEYLHVKNLADGLGVEIG